MKRQQQAQGSLDQTRALFERMAGEAVRRSELHPEEARSRGAVARVLLAITIVAGLLAGGLMVYGVYNFPDAPIRQTESGVRRKERDASHPGALR
jgi:hypothetical protein